MIKQLTLLILVFSFFSCNNSNGQKCSIPKTLQNEIEHSMKKNKLEENDFFRINNLLFEFEFDNSISSLKNCDCYTQNINDLFNSNDPIKRVLAYRLIGVVKDTSFNERLIEKIRSDENSLLKTWSSAALMDNKAENASDDLFKLFSSYPEGLPVDILINTYIQYDTTSVKKTCWKFINSDNRDEQIIAIQCLSNYESDENLQKLLLEFLETWDIETKGWIISSMSNQKMSELKNLLTKYIENDDLIEVVIRALKNSPTKEDNEFAKKLKKKKN